MARLRWMLLYYVALNIVHNTCLYFNHTLVIQVIKIYEKYFIDPDDI